jgi:hypothetical protein
MEETLKTVFCYNGKHLDEKDDITEISPLKYKCILQSSYRYTHSRSDHPEEKVSRIVIK